MAKYSSADAAFVLIDGYSIAAYLTNVAQKPSESMTEDVTCLSDTWRKQADVSVKDAEFSIEGFFDDTANTTKTALRGLTGTTRIAMVGPAGNTIGRTFYGYQVIEADAEEPIIRGELAKVRATFKGAAQSDQGLIIHALTADSGSSGTTQPGSSVDNGASSANGAVGYLEVTALTLGGYTSVTIKLRHSTDNSSYADLITFTNITAAPGKERLTVAGTVNRYLATSYAFNGAGSGQSVTYAVGAARG